MAFLSLLLDSISFLFFFTLMVSQGTHWDTHVRDWQEQTHLVHRAPGCWVGNERESA